MERSENGINREGKKKMVILRTLLENNLSRNRALTAEHGLSFLVETGDKKILFDCSAGKAASYVILRFSIMEYALCPLTL